VKKNDDALIGHVVEWCVEDPDRYERISGHSLLPPPPNGVAPRFRSKVEREAFNNERAALRPSVVVLVLVVPREDMQSITQALRDAPKIRPTTYVPKLGPAADYLTAINEDMLRAQTRAEALEGLVRSVAGMRPDTAADREKIRQWADDQIKLLPQTRYDVVKRNLDQMRAAVSERKVDVAAKMLAQVDDDL